MMTADSSCADSRSAQDGFSWVLYESEITRTVNVTGDLHLEIDVLPAAPIPPPAPAPNLDGT